MSVGSRLGKVIRGGVAQAGAPLDLENLPPVHETNLRRRIEHRERFAAAQARSYRHALEDIAARPAEAEVLARRALEGYCVRCGTSYFGCDCVPPEVLCPECGSGYMGCGCHSPELMDEFYQRVERGLDPDGRPMGDGHGDR